MLKRKACSACKKEKTIKHGFYNEKRCYCIMCERDKSRARMNSLENRARTAWRHAYQKAEKLGVENTLTMDEVMYLFKLADGRCAYTGEYGNLSLEHVIPMAKKGPNSISNVLVVDLDANRKKNNSSMMSFIDERYNPHDVLPLVKLLAARANRDYTELYDELYVFQREESERTYKKVVATLEKKNGKKR